MMTMAFPPDMPEKKDPKAATEKPDDKIGSLLDDAEAGGKLEPIKGVLAKLGRDDIDAKEILTLAQKDDRTNSKPVEEIASMLESDPDLLDDLMEYRDGGAFASRGMGMDKKKADAPPPKDEDTDEADTGAPGPSAGMM